MCGLRARAAERFAFQCNAGYILWAITRRVGRSLMKTCNICHVSKPLDAFSVLKKGADGKHRACKTCRADQSRARYVKNRSEILQKRRERLKQSGGGRGHTHGLR